MNQHEDVNSPKLIRLFIGAVLGTIIALIIGYGLCTALYTQGLALITPAVGTKGSFLSKSLLNYITIHHVRIIGSGLQGGPSSIFVSILWPITFWAIIPAIALMVGGWISSIVSGASGKNRFWAGASIAVFYTVALFVAGLYAKVPSVSINLPELGGLGPATDTVQAILHPSVLGTIFSGLVFGFVFGGIGAIGGFKGIWKGLFKKGGFLPFWARGACIALFGGQILLLVVLTIFAAVGGNRAKIVDRSEGKWAVVRSYASVLPALAGDVHYLSHGVTLRGSIIIKVPQGIPEVPAQTYRAGLLSGVVADGKTKSVPVWAYLLILIPAGMLTIGGFIAAKSEELKSNSLLFAIRFAGSYAILLSAFTLLFTLIAETIRKTGEMAIATTRSIGPSASQAFLFGLVLAFVFGLLGSMMWRSK